MKLSKQLLSQISRYLSYLRKIHNKHSPKSDPKIINLWCATVWCILGLRWKRWEEHSLTETTKLRLLGKTVRSKWADENDEISIAEFQVSNLQSQRTWRNDPNISQWCTETKTEKQTCKASEKSKTDIGGSFNSLASRICAMDSAVKMKTFELRW